MDATGPVLAFYIDGALVWHERFKPGHGIVLGEVAKAKLGEFLDKGWTSGRGTSASITPHSVIREGMMRSIRRVGVITAIVLVAPWVASAQTIGTFRWQTQPFCNVITVTVAQLGTVFQLTGTDDLCGAGIAPVTGTAAVAGADVVFGLTVASPTGPAAHISATISLTTVSGTWRDAAGNSGIFALTPGVGTGGLPRPAPVVSASVLSAVVTGAGVLTRGVGAMSASKDSVGFYLVFFNRDVSACTFVSSAGTTGSLGIEPSRVITVAGFVDGANGVFVSVYNPTGASVDSPFHLVVACP